MKQSDKLVSETTQGHVPARASRGDAVTKAEAKVSEEATENLILILSGVPQNRKGENEQALAGSTEKEAD